MSTDTAPTCYICYEEASAAQPFLTTPVCACKGSLSLHRACYEQVRLIAPDATMCSICKQVFNDPEMYVEFDETNMDGYRYVGSRHTLTKQFNGPYKIYYSNGALWLTTHYSNGARNGEHREYYEDGQLERECNYKDGELHGPYKQYWENGQCCVITNYIDGEHNGSYKEYYYDGKLAHDCTYKNGVKYGDSVRYYETGAKRIQTYDANTGNLLKNTLYYKSGNIEAVLYYSCDGELMQEIDYYDEIDVKEYEEIYEYGKCIYSARWKENGELYEQYNIVSV